MKWFKVSDEVSTNLVMVKDGKVFNADHNHPRFDDILGQLESEDEDGIEDLFDIAPKVEEFFKVSERITLRGSTLFFDNVAVDNVLADHVVRSIQEGNDDHMPFVKFWERVASNPNEHSRQQLLNWLMAEDFAITDDGFIVGYKGVNDELKSLTSGPGTVNGVNQNGQLDNSVGNVVEVARSYVNHDPSNGCSTGLHVGTWSYAANFGPKTVEVHVDPIDVVSVPTDSHAQKMRVCKYKVVRELTSGHKVSVLRAGAVEDEEDDWYDED